MKVSDIYNDFKTALRRLANVLSSFDPAPDIIVGGDFNLPHVKWPDGSPLPGASTEEQLMLNFLNEISNTLFLHQLVAEPTHKDGNVIDLVLVNNLYLVFGCEIQPVIRTISHHSSGVMSTDALYFVKTTT